MQQKIFDKELLQYGSLCILTWTIFEKNVKVTKYIYEEFLY